MTSYLLDVAPDGTQNVLRYSQSEMEELFTAAQRHSLANGEKITHDWHPRRATGHVIIDMVLSAKSMMEK